MSTEGPVRACEKPSRRLESYIPEPDPHDLCLMGSGDVPSPFACDEAVRPPGRRDFAAFGTGRPAYVIGG